jgi:glycosyltransferase involved in cell wall biosynthesis
MLTPYLPYPLHSGGQTRSYNLIKNLARNNEITLFSFIRREEEKKYIQELKKFCQRVEVFNRRPAWSPKNILLSGLTFYPFLVCIYLSKDFQRAIKQALETGKYDLIHAETFYVMPNIPKTGTPTILVEQTIEYMVYKHFVDEFKLKILTPLLLIDVFKIRFWEAYFWEKATRVIAVSESDLKEMHKLKPKLNIGVVPNGVDSDWFVQGDFTRPHPPTVLYVGNFKWLQNVEAVEILINRVWPIIKSKNPKAVLKIVGRGMDERIHRLKSDSIVIDETVEDIRQAYQNADLIVTPIEGPGGTRLKILEAMASKVPVVSTSVGVEGLKVENKKEVFISDDYGKMGEIAADLLKHPEVTRQVALRANKFVLSNYSWKAISGQLEKIYEQAKNQTP